MPTISADAILGYVLVAFGGFFVKYIWDKMIKEHDNKEEKIKKYDEKTLRGVVEDIVKESCNKYKTEMLANIEQAKAESKASYEYWQKMYWDAVHRLEAAQADFKRLEEQDMIFYKYLLIDTCKDYISCGGMTQYQFDRLAEWYKIYKTLGGNGQGDLYYKKAVELPIINKEDFDYVNFENEHNASIFDYNEQTKDRSALLDVENKK